MRAHRIPSFLLCLATLLTSFRAVLAQVPDTPEGYPVWVTNDYNCVIGCLQDFNEGMTERPNRDLEAEAYTCVGSTCSKDTMAMNFYQTQYIISMFYTTGSIYESEGMLAALTGTTSIEPTQVASNEKEAEHPSLTSEENVSSTPLSSAGPATSPPTPSTSGVNHTDTEMKPATTSSASSNGTIAPSSESGARLNAVWGGMGHNIWLALVLIVAGTTCL